MGDGSRDTAAAVPPPPAPSDLFDSFASNARDRENFRLLAAQGMRSNFLTGLRGIEGGPQVAPGTGVTTVSPDSTRPTTVADPSRVLPAPARPASGGEKPSFYDPTAKPITPPKVSVLPGLYSLLGGRSW